jgi:hypothetical protein
MIKITAQVQFWNWFIRNEPELFNFDPTREVKRERLLDEVASGLQKVDPDLTFKFGPNGTPKREFVISIGGIHRTFPAVVSLAEAAPPRDRWQVIAFIELDRIRVPSGCFRVTQPAACACEASKECRRSAASHPHQRPRKLHVS